MRKRLRRAVADAPSSCYLCGLPIPAEIVSAGHPLFGTVDHVVARSKNGPGAIWNRYPAHRVCNLAKGDGLVYPEEFARELHETVVPLLERFGRPVSEGARRGAVQRVVKRWPSWAPTLRRETNRRALERWEDDGGR